MISIFENSKFSVTNAQQTKEVFCPVFSTKKGIQFIRNKVNPWFPSTCTLNPVSDLCMCCSAISAVKVCVYWLLVVLQEFSI